MHSNKTKALSLLKKIQALAERGEAGERESAEIMLCRFMEKHNITLEDLEREDLKDRLFKVPIRFKQLFVQVAASIIGSSRAIYCIKGRPAAACIECTLAEYTEIELAFNFYKCALSEQLELYMEAFYQKNALYPSDSSPKPDSLVSDEDLLRMKRLSRLVEGMERVNHKKLVE